MKSGRDWGKLGMSFNAWKEIKLRDIVDVLGDGLHGTPKYDDYGEYYFINGNNLKGNIIVDDKTKKVNHEEYLKYKKNLGDRTILVSINGTLGNVALYNEEKIILGKSACYFNVSKNVDKYFVMYIMKSEYFKRYIQNYATGTTIKNMGLKQMREFSFALPSIPEQKAIASTLSCLDDKIELNNKINDNLAQQAKALYDSMFVTNADNSWPVGILADIANITMGQSPSGTSYNEDSNGEVFFQGRGEFGVRFPTRRLYTTEPKRMAERGDVLMSVRAPVGDLNVAYERCCIGRGLGAIHSKDDARSFLLYTMFSMQNQLNVFNGEGTVFGSINRNALNTMPIVIPDKETVQQYEKAVKPMDAIIENNNSENRRIQSIRDTLLPKLMSGEIDISGAII